MRRLLAAISVGSLALSSTAIAHGTVVSPTSRVYQVYQSNPQSPSFALAQNAVAIDGALSYYTWNEVSRNVPEAVQAGLPPGFDYSPWIPDGALASAGRTDPNSTLYPRTYAGLDQVGAWPATPVTRGAVLPIEFLVTAAHSPSVWDVWMTTPDWTPDQPLAWASMEFLERPNVTSSGSYYHFDVALPADRVGHHVLWIAWQRDDPAGEVFISTSDVLIVDPGLGANDCGPGVPNSSGDPGRIAAFGTADVAANDFSLAGLDLPRFSSGYFLVSPTSASVANPGGSAGVLCLGPPHGRFVTQVVDSGFGGNVTIDVDLTRLPRPTGLVAVQPGETWRFQLWHRDLVGGASSSNFTDALEVTFL